MHDSDSICVNCHKTIKITDRKCKYCGHPQYSEKCGKDICEITNMSLMGERMERSRSDVSRQSASRQKRKHLKEWSEEELLTTGLYPKNECIKIGLIARILGKRK